VLLAGPAAPAGHIAPGWASHSGTGPLPPASLLLFRHNAPGARGRKERKRKRKRRGKRIRKRGEDGRYLDETEIK